MRLICLLLAALSLHAAEKKLVYAANGPKPVGPYSPGLLAGDFLYVSGQGARDPNNQFAATAEARVRQCFQNVKAIVEAAGLTMEHVVYTQVYLHESTPYELMNKVWGEFFPKNPPGRATLGVHRMPTETPIEINAIAVRDLKMKKPIVPDWYPKTMNIAPAVEAGGRIFLSGFLGRDIDTGKIPDDPAEQVRLGLTRIDQILKAAGLDWRHMVFVNPYHTSKVPRRVLDELYARKVEFGNTPARATIEVSFLPLGANIEFTGVAVRNLADRRAVEHGAECDRESVCICRRCVVLFGEGGVCAGSEWRNLVRQRRGPGADDDAESAGRVGGRRARFLACRAVERVPRQSGGVPEDERGVREVLSQPAADADHSGAAPRRGSQAHRDFLPRIAEG